VSLKTPLTHRSVTPPSRCILGVQFAGLMLIIRMYFAQMQHRNIKHSCYNMKVKMKHTLAFLEELCWVDYSRQRTGSSSAHFASDLWLKNGDLHLNERPFNVEMLLDSRITALYISYLDDICCISMAESAKTLCPPKSVSRKMQKKTIFMLFNINLTFGMVLNKSSKLFFSQY